MVDEGVQKSFETVIATVNNGLQERLEVPNWKILRTEEFDGLSDDKIILKLLFTISVAVDPTLQLFFKAARMLANAGKVKPKGINRYLKKKMDEEYHGISFYRTYFDEVSELGRGSFGTVYLARHKLDEKFYAIKKIEFVSRCQDDYKQSLVFREVRTLSQIHSRHVVRYYGTWVENKGMQASSSKHSLRSEPTDVDDISDEMEHISGDSWGGPTQTYGDLEDSFRSVSPMVEHLDLVEISSKLPVNMTKNNSYNDVATDFLNEVENRRNIWITINLYLQMEYSGHWTLKDFIRSPSRIPKKSEICAIISQILKGLVETHRHEVIHRDLKPDNVFIDRKENPYCSSMSFSDSREVALYNYSRPNTPNYTEPLDMNVDHWELKIGDFGLSRNLGVTTPRASTQPKFSKQAEFEQTRGLGTWPYTAPEQLGESEHIENLYNGSADIFSSGIIMYELMVPHYTTEHERVEVLDQVRKGNIPAETRERFPELSELLSALVSQNPDNRPSSQEALSRIQSCANLEYDELLSLSKRELAEEIIKLRGLLKEAQKSMVKERKQIPEPFHQCHVQSGPTEV